jgi:RNA polymerase-binding transcription factor DksA
MLNDNAIRDRLTERLVALKLRTEHIEAEIRQPLDDDFAEQVVDREDDETLDALEKAALAEIVLTEKALLRLDAGVYGTCSSCGGEIARERLEVLPAAVDCIGCASAKEKSGL